jgi:hypothetical protein
VRRLVLLLAPLAALAFVCGGSGTADLTDRDISDNELITMALPREELGENYGGFTPVEDNGLQTLDERVDGEIDEEDERADLERAGFVKAYDLNYTSTDALFGGGDVFFAGSSVDLYGDAAGAQADWEDELTNDFPNEVGKPDEDGATITSYDTYDVPDIADDAAGAIFRIDLGEEAGDLEFTATGVFIRRGRIIAGVGLVRVDDEDVKDEAISLARKLDERIVGVLEGDISAHGEPTSEPTAGSLGTRSPTDALNSFRATFETSIEGETSFTIRSEGTFQFPDRFTCSVSGMLGGVTMGKDDLVVIGNRAWLDVGDGAHEVDQFDPTVMQDVEVCPATAVFWTNFADFTDFSGLPSTSEVVGGTVANHYAVDDALEAATALGIPMPDFAGVTINAFDVWIADQGNWPVAFQMDFSGDTLALSQALGFPGEAAGGQGRFTLRVAIITPNDPNIDIQSPADPGA